MKKLLLAGAGHSHLVTITNIPRFTRAGVSVTVVGPGDDHYYSGMGPGLLAGMYRPEQTRFAVRRMTEGRGGVFFRDVVERIDAAERQVILSSGQVLEYDLLSCNMGSVVHGLPGDNKNLIPVKPVENLHQAAREIRTRLMLGPVRAAVVGGGAAGVELAANLVRLAATLPNHLDVTLISRDDLLLRHPSRARRVALDSLRKRGVSVLERAAVRQVRESRIDLDRATCAVRPGIQRVGHRTCSGVPPFRPCRGR
jgi:NADH dehydrogenase FAD-containing subunit